MNIAVVGGGASGLTAAIAAARAGAAVTIYEKLPRVGKKLLATGNGRCNFSNRHIDPGLHYHTASPETARAVLEAFSPAETLRFFDELGIPAREGEEGKLYPYSLQAAAVLDVLRFEAAALGVTVIPEQEILRAELQGGAFSVRDRRYDRLIVATGGRAAPQLGGGGSGHALLRSFGHTLTPMFPSIVQIKTDPAQVKPLKGIKIDAIVRILRDGQPVAEKAGELLFTEYGLSGPPVMHLSRLVSEHLAAGRGAPLDAEIDCLPGLSPREIPDMLRSRAERRPERLLEDFFVGMLPKRLGQTLLKLAGKSLGATAGSLTEEDIRALSGLAGHFRLRISGTRGFQDAQVTAGGVSLDEFDRHLQSRIVPGLYACGEVLDVDGDCGGYNLQWAWSSGILAGRGASVRQP